MHIVLLGRSEQKLKDAMESMKQQAVSTVLQSAAD